MVIMISVHASNVVDRRFKPRSSQPIDYETGIYCFSTKRAAFNSKRNDCLARNQANVSNMSLPAVNCCYSELSL